MTKKDTYNPYDIILPHNRNCYYLKKAIKDDVPKLRKFLLNLLNKTVDK
jgi:hypothetical protein